MSFRSYSVLTRESNAVFSWLHHRVPVILADKAAADAWLDPKQPDSFAALQKVPELKEGDIQWQPVSRYKDRPHI